MTYRRKGKMTTTQLILLLIILGIYHAQGQQYEQQCFDPRHRCDCHFDFTRVICKTPPTTPDGRWLRIAHHVKKLDVLTPLTKTEVRNVFIIFTRIGHLNLPGRVIEYRPTSESTSTSTSTTSAYTTADHYEFGDVTTETQTFIDKPIIVNGTDPDTFTTSTTEPTTLRILHTTTTTSAPPPEIKLKSSSRPRPWFAIEEVTVSSPTIGDNCTQSKISKFKILHLLGEIINEQTLI